MTGHVKRKRGNVLWYLTRRTLVFLVPFVADCALRHGACDWKLGTSVNVG